MLCILRDGNGAAVRFVGNGSEDALVSLVVVVSVGLGGLEAHMGIPLQDNTVGGNIHLAKLAGIEGNSALCIVDILIATDLGNIDLTVGQKDVSIHTHSIEHTQRLLDQLGDGRGGLVAHSFGLHLLHNTGQDLLVDADLQLLGVVSLLGHGDANVLGGIPTLVGGRIAAGGLGHGIGAVGIFHHTVGRTEQRDRLNFLNFHMLTDKIHIDQRRMLYTGAAGGGGRAGNRIERGGDQFLIDLIKHSFQIGACHGIIAVYIMDIVCNILIGDRRALGILVADAEGVVAAAPTGACAAGDGHITTGQPGVGIGLVGGADIGIGIGAVEVLCRVNDGIGAVTVGKIHTDAVNHRHNTVVGLHLCFAVSCAQQCTQGDHRIDIVAVVDLTDSTVSIIVKQGIQSGIGCAVGQQDRNGLTALGVVGICQHVHA